MIVNATTAIEDLTLLVEQEIHVSASLEDTFAALLEQLGPANEAGNGRTMPMVLEAWPGGRWYRDLASDGRAILQVRDQTIPVQAIPATDDASVAQSSEAFREKYRTSAYVGSIVRAEVLSTTLRLEPRPGSAAAA